MQSTQPHSSAYDNRSLTNLHVQREVNLKVRQVKEQLKVNTGIRNNFNCKKHSSRFCSTENKQKLKP